METRSMSGHLRLTRSSPARPCSVAHDSVLGVW